MAQIKREDISQEVFDLYDDYAHNKIDRCIFIERLSVFAVGALTLPTLLRFVQHNYANPTVATADDRFKSEYMTYESPNGGGTITALLSKPTNTTGNYLE